MRAESPKVSLKIPLGCGCAAARVREAVKGGKLKGKLGVENGNPFRAEKLLLKTLAKRLFRI